MNFIKKNKIVIIFYLIVIVCTYLLSIRVESLESKEDYYKYNQSIVMNFAQ